MSLNLFGWLNQVLVSKKSWNDFSDTDHKTFQPYMINRLLSMDDEFLEAVNYFQKYSVGLLESREVYKWYCDVLPKGKRYNKYIKNRNSKKYDKLLVSTVSTISNSLSTKTPILEGGVNESLLLLMTSFLLFLDI